MDIDVSGWILEFLLRQNSLDDHTLTDLIRVLPFPNNNPNLQKSLILRKLQSEIVNATISERTMEFLEQIEELDHREGITEVSDAMKTAYSAVAMHCTVNLIETSPGDKEQKYATAVEKIWSVRICEMERCGVGLVHEDLVRWVKDVEAKGLDGDVCDNVFGKFRDSDALEAVRCYVDEARETMGPSFLELACEAILNDDALGEAMGLVEVAELKEALRDREVSELGNQSKDGAPTDAEGAITKGNEALRDREVSKLGDQSKDAAPADAEGAINKGNEALRDREVSELGDQSKDGAPTDAEGAITKGNETSKAHVGPTHKHIALKRRRGVKIVDPVETSHERFDYIPSPEVNKVQEALESSTFELHAVVKDPLPDALRFAESLNVNTREDNEPRDLVGGNSASVANDKAPTTSHDRKGKALEANGDADINKDQEKRVKFNLLERNHTAHTTEWSDSIDSFEEESPKRPHLASPEKRKVSPLNVYKMEKLARRRKKKRWTPLEEDTLRTGVQKYGKGNWKLILSMYRDIFEDRTDGDLKDKWRNLTRY